MLPWLMPSLTQAFGKSFCEWAQRFMWAEHHEHADTSFAELLVNFLHTDMLEARTNIHEFRQSRKYPRLCFCMHEDCAGDLRLEAHGFAQDLKTFQAGLNWLRKQGVTFLSGDAVLKAHSLYIIRCNCPAEGVSHCLKCCCSFDQRVILQTSSRQRPASH